MAKKIQPIQPSETSESLLSPSFQSLLWTNFLTAFNDNVFRWLAIGIGKDYYSSENQGMVLMFGTACFVLPFILFAAPAGFLADRYRKRDVIIGCKILEIVIMALGVLAIFLQQFNFLLVTVFMMGAQSALFAPSKVGAIPEMMGQDKISKANGFFNLSSLAATIMGMGIGGWISDLTGDKGVEQYQWLPALVLIGLAVMGTITSLFLIPRKAQNPELKFPITMISEMVRDQKRLFANKALFVVALGIIFYWTIAALGQINVDQFADESGGLRESHRTPLLISLVLGVGLGSVLAGFLSGGRIELGLVPWGALGIVVFCFLLFLSPTHFISSEPGFNYKLVIACTLLVCLGASAGFFQIPMASYLQHKSPAECRGSILSAVNCLIFGGMLVVSVLFSGMRVPFHQGKFDGIPDNYQKKSLSSEQQIQFDELVSQYNPDRQSVDEFTKAIDDKQIRNTVLASLVWKHVEKEQADNTRLPLNELNRLFPPEKVSDDATRKQIKAAKREHDTTLRVVKETHRQAGKLPLLTSRHVFLVMCLMTLPILCYAVYRLQHAMARIFLWWGVRGFYRIKVVGRENIPANGGAMLVSNHVSLFDGILFLLMTTRTTRMIAWSGNFKNPITRWLAKFSRTILMGGGPKSITKALGDARKALGRGELVGIFPEGGITRSGNVQAFKPGLMRILDKTPVPIIPVYIDEMFGSNLSYANGGSILRIPKKFRRHITVNIGKPIERTDEIHFVRQQVQQLGATAVNNRQSPFVSPVQKFIRNAKKRRNKLKVGCSTGQDAKGGAFLMRTLILRRLLARHILDDRQAESHVGVLLPPSFGGVAVNIALAMDHRVAVNLNYTVSSEILNFCIKQAGIKKVLTSKKVWEKFDYELDAEIVFLEELKDKVTTGDKVAGIVGSYLMPAAMLEKKLGLNDAQPDDVLTIIFTSGSTGVPKGVVLTNQNVASNVDAIGEVVNLNSKDVMVGILPFFHSFGYTVTLWGAMGLNIAGVYHFSPLDAKQIGKLTKRYGGTVLLGTPTFLRSYIRRIDRDEFATINTVVAGAEKLPKDLCDSFERKFGVRPVEGYGTTELSPLVSVNVPPVRSRNNFQIDYKEGTVGRPIPNVAAKITALDDDTVELNVGESGMLWITGPNVMKGYLNRPDATAEVIKDGWYKTGDVALIDKDGFIQITGRMSRFSKIGGEMVPHVRIEELLNSFVGEDEDEDGEIDEMKLAVTAVPDNKKGERLIVLHKPIHQEIGELTKRLSEEGLPNIFIPSVDSFVEVDQLPMLGSGKLDLKNLKDIALEKFAAKE